MDPHELTPEEMIEALKAFYDLIPVLILLIKISARDQPPINQPTTSQQPTSALSTPIEHPTSDPLAPR